MMNDKSIHHSHLHHFDPKGKNCAEMMLELSEYVDGSLPEAMCAEIREHLQTCQNCTIVVDTLKKTISLYQQSSETDRIPEDVRKRLYHKLDLADFL